MTDYKSVSIVSIAPTLRSSGDRSLVMTDLPNPVAPECASSTDSLVARPVVMSDPFSGDDGVYSSRTAWSIYIRDVSMQI